MKQSSLLGVPEKPENVNKMTTPELTQKLHEYYKAKAGAWAFITQLRNGTGYSGITRTADAMAMGLWPSTGLELVGFELKVSRSDWLHELKQPKKAEEMKQFCDKWYLVIPSMSIIKDGELPAGWGLMVASGRGQAIKEKIKAPKLEPADVDRLLLASIFRNVTEKTIPYDMHQNALKQTKQYAEENILRIQKGRLEAAAATELKIKEFEDATGIKFEDWRRDHMELAKIVKAAIDNKYDNIVERIKMLRDSSERVTKFIDGEIGRYDI